MSVRLGVVMDPIGNINVKKDSTLAMLRAGHRVVFEPRATAWCRA